MNHDRWIQETDDKLAYLKMQHSSNLRTLGLRFSIPEESKEVSEVQTSLMEMLIFY